MTRWFHHRIKQFRDYKNDLFVVKHCPRVLWVPYEVHAVEDGWDIIVAVHNVHGIKADNKLTNFVWFWGVG
jgi:hypothetical protein